MNVCENCGNNYDKAFKVIMNNQEHIFDSFECAINQLAPLCTHCKCRIIGHGVEAAGQMFCCSHCASELGVKNLRDRAT